MRTVRMFVCLFVFLQYNSGPSIMWRDGQFTFWTLNVQKHVLLLRVSGGEHGQSEVFMSVARNSVCPFVCILLYCANLPACSNRC